MNNNDNLQEIFKQCQLDSEKDKENISNETVIENPDIDFENYSTFSDIPKTNEYIKSKTISAFAIVSLICIMVIGSIFGVIKSMDVSGNINAGLLILYIFTSVFGGILSYMLFIGIAEIINQSQKNK